MPLFGGKFSPKKTPARKSNTKIDTIPILVSERRNVELNLDAEKLLFDGQWIAQSGAGGLAHKTNQKLRKKVQDLTEENNLLRLKYELMLNMVNSDLIIVNGVLKEVFQLTQTTAESHMQERKIESLRKGRLAN